MTASLQTAATAKQLFSKHVDSALLEQVEAGQWPERLWRAVEEAGLQDVLLLEATDAPWQHCSEILAAAGHFCVPLPLAETMLARYCIAGSGDEVGTELYQNTATIMTWQQSFSRLRPATAAYQNNDKQVAKDLREIELSGEWRQVAFARHSRFAIVEYLQGTAATLGLLDLQQGRLAGTVELQEHNSICGEPRDTVILHKASVTALPANPFSTLQLPLACMRSMQISAAIQSVLQQSIRYANEREQFGRPIGKFQAIQHSLAQLAGESACANMAVQTAVTGMADTDNAFAIACAKIRCGEAAGVAAAIAHQIHGAMGFTREHALHESSRRLWTWRAEYGDESWWAKCLGEAAIEASQRNEAMWPWLTAATLKTRML